MANTDAPFAEELIDLVIQHCQAGEAQKAQDMTRAIEDQLSPPPEILALLAQINQTGCKPTPQASRDERRFSAVLTRIEPDHTQ